MRKANIKGALVGVEAVTPEGLKDVYKGFNEVGEALVERLRKFREHGVHVLGSFIFGLPSDRSATFDATADVAERAGVTFAQFVMLTPYPGTVDFERLGEERRRGRRTGGRHSDHAPLAHPAGATPEGLCAASGDDAGRNPPAHPGGVGSVLQLAAHLGPLQLHAERQSRAGVRPDFEALPSDVREHRDCDRQRASQPGEPVGPPDRATVPPPLYGAPAPGAGEPVVRRVTPEGGSRSSGSGATSLIAARSLLELP